MRRSPLLLATLAVTGTLSLAACAGGASDVVAQPGSTAAGAATSTINLYAYAVPKVGFDKVIPAFQATAAGQGRRSSSSPTAPRATSRARSRPAPRPTSSTSRSSPTSPASSTPGWSTRAGTPTQHKGIPFGSVVTIVVRKGNPKGIKDWDDLLKPGVEVVTPNPFSSGSAKWNLLAPYAAKSNGGTGQGRPASPTSTSWSSDHVKIQPKSGREATETFLQGTGDVLLSYENEALFVERNGDPVEHVTPPHDVQDREPGRRASRAARTSRRPRRSTTSSTRPRRQKLLGRGRLPPGRPDGRRGVRRGLPGARRSSGRSPTSAAGRTSTTTLFEQGRRRHRQDLRRGHPVARRQRYEPTDVDDPTRATAASAALAARPRTVRRRRRPRATAGGRAGPRRAPGAVGPLGVGVVTLWLSVIVLLPLAALTVAGVRRRARPASGTRSPRPPRSPPCGSPCSSRSVVALLNAVMGTLIAWVLVRDDFRGKRLVNALIDLPFALPTIVASIVLLSLYGPHSPIGVHLNATRSALVVALLVRDAAVRRPLGAAGADRGRPRGRGGRGVARAPATGRPSAGSCCRRWRRRCSAAPGSPSRARSASTAPSC